MPYNWNVKTYLCCNTCGKSFMTDFHRYNGRFCSDECYQEYNLRRATVICGEDKNPAAQVPYIKLEDRIND